MTRAALKAEAEATAKPGAAYVLGAAGPSTPKAESEPRTDARLEVDAEEDALDAFSALAGRRSLNTDKPFLM